MSPYRTAAHLDPLPRARLTGDALCVSDENLGECGRALDAVLSNIRRLRDTVSKYPVFVEFAGYRFCLESQASLDELAVSLECKVAEQRGRLLVQRQ